MSKKTYAIPRQTPRPALDAALTALEEESKTGRCGVCGKVDMFGIRWHGQAFLKDGKMSPWMCQDCAKEWP